MADLDHFWGGDLTLSPTGDLATVQGAARGQQRIIRRLCSNGSNALDQPVGEYLFHPDYGAGLPRLVGEPGISGFAEAVSREQMLMEPAVQQSPPPGVTISQSALGLLSLTIAYVDVPTQTPQTLSFDVAE